MKRATRRRTKPQKKRRQVSHRTNRKTSSKRHKKQPKKSQREYDFCLSKDRKAFYQKLRADYKKQIVKREPEESSAIRVDIDIGEQTRKKRKATAFIGHRRFIHLGRLRKFLLLDARQASGLGLGGIDWSRKTGMCQYPKYARIILIPVHPRGRVKILHTYRLKQPL